MHLHFVLCYYYLLAGKLALPSMAAVEASPAVAEGALPPKNLF